MPEEIRVHVVKFKSCRNLMMRYLDPDTGKHVARSTGTTKRREAERIAAKWEAELREGRYQKPSRLSWDDFCDQFNTDGTIGLKESTIHGYLQTLDSFKRNCRPKTVADLTTARVTAFVRELRKPYQEKFTREGEDEPRTRTRSPATIARHLRHLKRICRWAQRQGYLSKTPEFEMPKRAGKRMKGRPITKEEFDRMLAATPDVVGEKAAKSWEFLLHGLWESGLRLGEALSLRWDQQPHSVRVILNGNKSVLAFDAGSQKSNRVELAPLAPGAVELLQPRERIAGFVFIPRRQDGAPMARDTHKISRIICQIGKKANVLVDPKTGKTASAHDLRRAFGHRWSRRAMPPQLKELMRHASIETTMTYYVGHNAESTAQELWRALGKELGKVDPKQHDQDETAQEKAPENRGKKNEPGGTRTHDPRIKSQHCTD